MILDTYTIKLRLIKVPPHVTDTLSTASPVLQLGCDRFIKSFIVTVDDFFFHDVVNALLAFDHVVKHSDTRPSDDYAKDWVDQSFRFPIWALL